MLSSSLGGFTFSPTGVTENIILMIFLFLANIILLNLLIAILSNTYAVVMERNIVSENRIHFYFYFRENCNMEYALIVYDDYMYNRFDKKYGLMVALPAPCNVYSFALLPVLLISKSSRLN